MLKGNMGITKVSGTIADLAGSDDIKPEHLAEAIQYRSPDREDGRGELLESSKLSKSCKFAE